MKVMWLRIWLSLFTVAVVSNLHAESSSAVILSVPGVEKDPGAVKLSKRIPALGPGVIYDLRERAASQGLVLQTNELLLYSPASCLVYGRSNKENVQLARELFSPFTTEGPINYSVELLMSQGSHAPPRILGEMIIQSGLTRDIHIGNKRITLEFTVGPDGQWYEYTLHGSIQFGSELVSINGSGIAMVGRYKRLTSTKAYFHDKKTHDILLFATPKYTAAQMVDQLHQSAAWQAERCKEVDAYLSNKNGG